MNRTAKTVLEATMAPNETLTLHFEDDLAVVVHPHACHESCELQGGASVRDWSNRGVNVLTSRKQRVFESQLGIPLRRSTKTANTAENVSLACRAGERMGHDDAPSEGILNRSNSAPAVTFSGVAD